MFEFLHNIGSKFLQLFSNKFGVEASKRHLDSLGDEADHFSPAKRFKLDMEQDSRFEHQVSSYGDSYKFRSDSRLRQTVWPASAMSANAGSSFRPAGISANNTKTVTGSGGGFNFSASKQEVRDCGTFQFTPRPEVMKFQGFQPPVNGQPDFGQQSLVNGQSMRTNGQLGLKRGSVFSRMLGEDRSRGIKSIDIRKRNKLAVKKCFRLEEKKSYQAILMKQMNGTPSLPPCSVERHISDRQLDRSYSARNAGVGLFNHCDMFASTKLNESTCDTLKRRLDVTSSLLSSAVSSAKCASSSTLPIWRQSAVNRGVSAADIPERSFQTLQNTRHQPLKAFPMRSSVAPPAESRLNFVEDCFVTEESPRDSKKQPFVPKQPVTIETIDLEQERKSSNDSDAEVVLLESSPSASNDSKLSFGGRRSVEKRSTPEAFEKAFRESRYASKDFLLHINSKTQNDFRRQNIQETETAVKFYKEEREKNENLLINKMERLLRVSARIPVPLEEEYIALPDEEEEVCEIIDDDDEVRAVSEEEEEEEEEDEVEEISDEFPELTKEQDAIVSRALVPSPPDQVLVDEFRLQLTRRDIATLAGLNWLNDEVINFYFNLIMDRSKTQGYPKVYAFNTFFYPKVQKEGHKAVRRWTKSIDLFALDYVLIPVHLGNHWCLAVVDFRKKEIRYYDSMGMNNRDCLQALKGYLSEEHKVKHQTDFDFNKWQVFPVKNIPQQMNGSDCGMFACKFAEYISRDAPISFDQHHMPYFRRRMVYEILTKKLM